MMFKVQYVKGARGSMVTTPSAVCPYPDQFAYNPKNEITNAILAANNFGYAYDPIGNRVTATKNEEPENYSANQLNQYTQIADGVTNFPTYDLDGNMLTYNGWTFTWNGENRLVQASNAAHVISYAYDYQGRMFQKVVDGVTNSFIWDGFNIIAEISPSQTNFNVWGLDLSGTLQGAGGVGGLLSVAMPSAPCAMHFPLADGNGNVTEYVQTNGTVVAHREYSAFGETLALTGTKKDDFAFWFSTKPYDPLTKISHYQRRDYWAELGRWGSRDPIGGRGGQHMYSHTRNGTPNRIDAVGFSEFKLDWTEPKDAKDLKWEWGVLPEEEGIDKWGRIIPVLIVHCRCCETDVEGPGKTVVKVHSLACKFGVRMYTILNAPMFSVEPGDYKKKNEDHRTWYHYATSTPDGGTVEHIEPGGPSLAYGHEQRHAANVLKAMKDVMKPWFDTQEKACAEVSQNVCEERLKTIQEDAEKEFQDKIYIPEAKHSNVPPAKGTPYDAIGVFPDPTPGLSDVKAVP